MRERERERGERSTGAVGRKAFGRSVGGLSTAFEGCGRCGGGGRRRTRLLLLLLLSSLQASAAAKERGEGGANDGSNIIE